ncbi:MAG: hypothetical protein KatS3mg100_071 [Candidatus Parcubacteria bacterium]|nr:MAG: hypothetical protein KatS3mg100_071 [Candidatus Parcubacteria bacterium]
MRYVFTKSFWRFVGGFALLVSAGLVVTLLAAPAAQRELQDRQQQGAPTAHEDTQGASASVGAVLDGRPSESVSR